MMTIFPSPKQSFDDYKCFAINAGTEDHTFFCYESNWDISNEDDIVLYKKFQDYDRYGNLIWRLSMFVEREKRIPIIGRDRIRSLLRDDDERS